MPKNKRVGVDLARLDRKMGLLDVLTSRSAKQVKLDIELEKYARVSRDVSMADFVQLIKPAEDAQP